MNMLRCVMVVILPLLVVPCLAQDVTSKDGVVLGKRSDFIASCTNGADEMVLSLEGVKVEALLYCTCVCDNLLPSINSWEMEAAINEDRLMDLFFEDENLEIVMECLEGNYNVADEYMFEASDNMDFQVKVGVKKCVSEIMDDPEMREIWPRSLAEAYCNCAMNKLFTAGYSYKEILEIEDENSTSFNEIALPCIAEVMKEMQGDAPSNSNGSDDIQGGGESSLVPLVDYFGKGYKIKISMGGVTKYFLFDTGASDIIIDRETERELLINGELTQKSYLEKTSYTLANKDVVTAQKVVVDNVKIGDYTVHNVVMAVMDEGSLLCGKSFLDKFKNWEIDVPNKVLTLYK